MGESVSRSPSVIAPSPSTVGGGGGGSDEKSGARLR